MRYLTLLTFLTLSFIAFSCGQYDNQDYGYDNEYAMEYYDEAAEANAYGQYTQAAPNRNQQIADSKSTVAGQSFSTRTGSNGIKMYPLVDPKTGMASSYIPLPAGWKVTPNKWVSPTGSEVNMRKGIPINASVSSIDQVIQQIIIPAFQQDGVREEAVVDLPSVRQADQREQDGYYSYANAKSFVQAKGIAFSQPSSNLKLYAVVHFLVKRSQFGQTASYWFHLMGAYNSPNFQKDTEALIYGLSNFQMNQQWVANYNRQMQGQLASNDAQFQRKQKENWDHFNKMQDINKTNSSVNDIYFDMYKNKNAMNDEGHSKAVNGVHERNAMINPYTGQQINLSNNYKYYYMNQFGQYFGTNDEFYSPERDPSVNHIEWRKVKYSGN